MSVGEFNKLHDIADGSICKENALNFKKHVMVEIEADEVEDADTNYEDK